jgi:ATP-dependent DNA helicase RecQ
MSKRVTAVRRKSASRVSNRAVSSKKKSSKRVAAKSKALKKVPKKAPTRKSVASRPTKRVAPKKKAAKMKALVAASPRGKTAAKKKRTAKPARKVVAVVRRRSDAIEKPKPTWGPVKAKAAPKVIVPRQAPKNLSNSGPPTPRSITPPAISDPKPALLRARARNPVKAVVRAAYVSPAQRVMEAQAAAQSRAKRVQTLREEPAIRPEVAPASEVASTADNDATSSEPRTGAAFVRRGRLGPRDPNSSPGSEPQSSTAIASEAFGREWRLIAATAQRASIALERELIQGWLEPWLNGKDSLALVRSAPDSGDAYFVATQALSRKTIVVQRSSSVASEIAARFTRLGLNVYSLSTSDVDRKATLSQFISANAATLVVPLEVFDDAALMTELQQLKINGLVAEEAQRVSELSFDFDVAYDRLPTIITRLGRPPTLAILRSAPPSARTDLPHRLGLRSPQRVDLQPLPETIALEVPVVDIPHRGGTLLERVGQATHPIMVLCAAPEEVDEILEVFARASVSARPSWALPDQIRAPMTPPAGGVVPVITVGVSGMTSNRDPLPRTLIHYHAPSSLEQYSRDLGYLDTAAGNTSAIVLAALEDEPSMRQWLDRQRPRPEDLLQVATVLTQHAGPGKMALVDTLSASVGVGRARLESLLSLLASAGWVEHKRDWVRVPETCTDLLDRARALAARLRSLRERDHQRMRSVSAYVIGRNCRHESMRRHFGTAAQRPCGLCDNCRTKAAHLAANDTPSQTDVAAPSSSTANWDQPATPSSD